MLFHSILFNTLANSMCKENSTDVMLVGVRVGVRGNWGPKYLKVASDIFVPFKSRYHEKLMLSLSANKKFRKKLKSWVPVLHGYDLKFYINILII